MAVVRQNRRQFKQRRDCLMEYNDRELVDRFRLDAAGIRFIESLVRDDISSGSNRNCALTSMQKVLITLRFLATGKMQLCNGDDMGVSQPSVSRAVTATVRSLSSNRLVARFVRFPLTIREIQQKQEEFYAISHFPGIVGAIDGTHIQITAPSVYENEFVNRHHYHSVNVQIVVDARSNILDVVAKWPGSTHDSRILAESGLRQLFDDHHVPVHTHLIGDSGYPSKRWLLTPFLRPQPGHQTNYNRAHKRTRSVVERGIGQLKRRFHVLHGEIRMAPDKACQIMLACAVLHNICKLRQIPVPGEDNDDDGGRGDGDGGRGDGDGDGGDDVGGDAGAANANLEGVRYRQQFANTHF